MTSETWQGHQVRERERNPISFIKANNERADAPRADATSKNDEQERLICEVCRSLITTTAARMELFGGHVHSRINPGGYVYRIGLFADAPGVKSVTTPTYEFSWFPGYAWQIAVCRGCLEHLGWEFGGEKRFFALLPEKLLIERGE